MARRKRGSGTVTTERVRLDRLKPSAFNPREMSDDALAGLEASVERFGLVEPIVWNRRSGHVVGGHQRLKVLEARGETATDVSVVDLGETDEKALCLTLNNRLVQGEFTEDLAALVAEIAGQAPDAVEDLRLSDLVNAMSGPVKPGKGDPDALPALHKTAVTRPGDVWTLGDHRLVCGDSRDVAVATAATGGRPIRLCVTDPPFEMPAFEQMRAVSAGGSRAAVVLGGGAEWFRLVNLAGWRYCWDAVVTFAGVRAMPTKRRPAVRHNRVAVLEAEVDEGEDEERTDVAALVKRGESSGFDGKRFAAVSGTHTSVLHCKAPMRLEGHALAKPVEFFLPWLHAFEDGEVWEPFCGSGTMILAASMLGKRCLAAEIEPRYCDLAVRRWQAFTGAKAQRHGPDGKPRKGL